MKEDWLSSAGTPNAVESLKLICCVPLSHFSTMLDSRRAELMRLLGVTSSPSCITRIVVVLSFFGSTFSASPSLALEAKLVNLCKRGWRILIFWILSYSYLRIHRVLSFAHSKKDKFLTLTMHWASSFWIYLVSGQMFATMPPVQPESRVLLMLVQSPLRLLHAQAPAVCCSLFLTSLLLFRISINFFGILSLEYNSQHFDFLYQEAFQFSLH